MTKNKHKQTKTTYIFTECPLPLNAFQSNATDACNRTNVIGCWLRAIWRTRSPSSHPPPQLSGSSLGVLKFLKWYGQGRCHIRHKCSLSPRVPPVQLFQLLQPQVQPRARSESPRRQNSLFPKSQAPEAPGMALWLNGLAMLTPLKSQPYCHFFNFFSFLFFNCSKIHKT